VHRGARKFEIDETWLVESRIGSAHKEPKPLWKKSRKQENNSCYGMKIECILEWKSHVKNVEVQKISFRLELETQDKIDKIYKSKKDSDDDQVVPGIEPGLSES
jgi:hypothetical protein